MSGVTPVLFLSFQSEQTGGEKSGGKRVTRVLTLRTSIRMEQNHKERGANLISEEWEKVDGGKRELRWVSGKKRMNREKLNWLQMMEESAGDRMQEQDGKPIMQRKTWSHSSLESLGCTCLSTQFVSLISFPRERLMYSAVHMCGSFPADRICYTATVDQGSWPETSPGFRFTLWECSFPLKCQWIHVIGYLEALISLIKYFQISTKGDILPNLSKSCFYSLDLKKIYINIFGHIQWCLCLWQSFEMVHFAVFFMKFAFMIQKIRKRCRQLLIFLDCVFL